MLKISKKIQFSSDENKMNSIANTKIARDLYYSSKSQKHPIQSGIFKFVRTVIILAVTITIVAAVIAVSTNAFKKRQQDMYGKVEN